MSQPSPIRIQSVKKRIRDFREVNLGYARRSVVEEARRCPQCTQAACREACPLGVDIPLFIRFLREGDFPGALAKIREANPFPEICGRLCPAPCEAKCILHQEGFPIEIRELERAAHDHGRKRFAFAAAAFRSGPRVAVIGSGLCGLTAAQRLAERDFQVTVFESLAMIGGVLRTGIPEFRLPRTLLDHMRSDLRQAGVVFENHITVGKNQGFDDLFQAGYRAILMATGPGGMVIPDMPGIFLRHVYAAEEVLWQANLLSHELFKREMADKLKDPVVILGQTERALDVARLGVRLGRKVEVVFADIADGLKVHPHDRQQVLDEGIRLRDLTRPIAVVSDEHGSAAGVKCLNLDYGDPERKGEWHLMPVPESEHVLPAGTVIFADAAFSQTELRTSFEGLVFDASGSIRIDPASGMTDIPGVFAAGTAVCRDASVVDIIKSCQEAIQKIYAHLTEGIQT